MMLPGPERWLFSFKTFAAAMLAFSVCLWLDLSRPYWAVATVYIASHPLSGATRSKAVFRALGTLIGSAAAILMVPNLASAPVLLVLAMALWSALCLYICRFSTAPRAAMCSCSRDIQRRLSAFRRSTPLARSSTSPWRAPRRS